MRLMLGLAGLALAHVGPAATWIPAVRRLLPGLAGVGAPGHVALTFDDGPGPGPTPLFLDELARLGCHATFFVLGERLAEHPELGRRMAREGHEVAVHGWRHVNALRARPGRVAAELGRAARLVTEVTGAAPAWYRPPYGVLSAEALLAARRLGLRPILWTTWGRDWTATATPASVLATAAPGLRGGATLLLHDSPRCPAPDPWRATLAALPDLVAACHEHGLTVGPLREHGLRSSARRADRDTTGRLYVVDRISARRREPGLPGATDAAGPPPAHRHAAGHAQPPPPDRVASRSPHAAVPLRPLLRPRRPHHRR